MIVNTTARAKTIRYHARQISDGGSVVAFTKGNKYPSSNRTTVVTPPLIPTHNAARDFGSQSCRTVTIATRTRLVPARYPGTGDQY